LFGGLGVEACSEAYGQDRKTNEIIKGSVHVLFAAVTRGINRMDTEQLLNPNGSGKVIAASSNLTLIA
jgi:hypothetical protein